VDRKPDRVKIGLLGLMIELYDRLGPALRESQDGFAQEMAGTWADWADVVWPGVANTRAKVDEAVGRFHAEGCDVIVVVCLAYAPSLIAARALLDSPLPIVLLDTQRQAGPGAEPTSDFLIENHGVHGVQDLANVLLRGGKSVPIIVGDWRANDTVSELQDRCLGARGRTVLRTMRVGAVGPTLAGMGDLNVDETAFALQVGPDVVPIATERVARLAGEASDADVAKRVKENESSFEIDPELTAEQHAAAVRVSLSLERIAAEDDLQALAVYFLTVSEDGRIPTLPFLAASRLMADGLGYAGEGDVSCASLVAAQQRIVGIAGFTEMFAMDFDEDSILMQHMGEGNYAMGRTDRKPLLRPRPFPLSPTPEAPATPCFALAPGPATVSSLFAGPEGRFRLVVSECDVADWGPFPELRTPHFRLAPKQGLKTFIEAWSRAGGSHHQAICPGYRARLIAALGEAAGVETILI